MPRRRVDPEAYPDYPGEPGGTWRYERTYEGAYEGHDPDLESTQVIPRIPPAPDPWAGRADAPTAVYPGGGYPDPRGVPVPPYGGPRGAPLPPYPDPRTGGAPPVPPYAPGHHVPGGGPLPPRAPRRRRRGRLLVRLLLALVLLYVVFYLALGAWVLSRLQRVDALGNYPGRPGPTAGQTWLLVGSDSREGLDAEERRRLRTGSTEGQRTDTILLLHVPSTGEPTLVSLPRDSYLDVPAAGSRPAHKDKLNAAYAIGGAPLLARTVEQATGLRLDHYTEVGFAGVVGLVDGVGGVEVCVDRAIQDSRAGLNVKAGCQEMDGPTSLGYVRARYSDPRGDLGRVERQRTFLAALVGEVARPSTLLNPIAAARLAGAGTEALTVDEDTGPVDLMGAARAMSRVSSGQGTTTTVPVADPDYPTPVGSAVLWDQAGAAQLFRRLR